MTDSWTSLTIAAGDLQNARSRVHAALPDCQGLDAVLDHIDDTISDVEGAIAQLVERQDQDRLDRILYDREVAMALRGIGAMNGVIEQARE